MFPARSASFFIGLLSLGSETLWVRTFSFARESTPQSFSIVLAIYLFGIAAGAMIGGRLCKSRTDLIKIAATSIFAASVILALSPALVVLAMQAIRSMRLDDALELAAMSLKLIEHRSPGIHGNHALLLLGSAIMGFLMFSTAALFSICFPICHHLGTNT